MLRRWINDLGMIVLALALAIVIWIIAVQEENPITTREYEEAIPVEVRNQPEQTTFQPGGFVEQVRFTLMAPQSNWQDLRPDKMSAWIDLTDQEPGNYEMPVQYACTDPNVRILELRPATVLVRLKEEISRTVPVQIQLYGSAAFGYKMKTDEAIIEPEEVTVTGPASIVNQVTKATLDLYLREEIKETFVGSRSVSARQANGDPVGSTIVSVSPATVQITIPVEHQTGFNEVVIRPRLTGTVAPGYLLSSASVDPITVLLGGDPDVVSRIGGYVETMPLDISGATGDVVERLALNLPEGASPVGVQGVTVTVKVASQQGSVTVVRRPVVRGLSTDLTAEISPSEVEVTVIGPLPRLEALTDEDIYVYVELVERGTGSYRVQLTSLVPAGLEAVSISPDTVDVQIASVSPTPTPTLIPKSAPTATPRPSPTPTVSDTATISATPGITMTLTPTGTAASGNGAQSTLTPNPDTTPPVSEPPGPTPIITPTNDHG